MSPLQRSGGPLRRLPKSGNFFLYARVLDLGPCRDEGSIGGAAILDFAISWYVAPNCDASGMELAMDFTRLLDLRCRLGESPVWDDPREMLFFVDAMALAVHAVRLDGSGLKTWPTPKPVGSIGLTDSGHLIAALWHGLVVLAHAGCDLATGKHQLRSTCVASAFRITVHRPRGRGGNAGRPDARIVTGCAEPVSATKGFDA